MTTTFAVAISFVLWQRWRVPGIETRKAVLLFADILVLSSLVNFTTVLCVLLVSLGCYTVGTQLADRRPGTDRKDRNSSGFALLTISVAFLVGLLAVAKYPLARWVLSATHFADLTAGISLVQVLGLSYLFFKLVHFLVDAYRGLLPSLDIVTYLNYLFFFPTYLAGPIDRYQNFDRWLRNESHKKDALLIRSGLYRLMIGIIKTKGLVPLIVGYALDFDKVAVSGVHLVNVLVSLVAYSLYLYLDFSGLSDLAIGSGMMLGFRVPENFTSPYLATNISEFWKRWHRSLSSILREYVFVPTVKALSRRYPRAPRLLITIAGYFVTFVICGAWHGSGLHFVLWGLWHGLGLSLHKLWEVSALRRQVAEAAPPSGRTFARMAAAALTFAFVTLGWLFFNYPVGRIITVLGLSGGLRGI